jgi:hypothetical protein
MMSGWVELAIAFVTGVIGPITVLYIKSKLDQGKKKPDMVKETLRVSELVTNKIEHIKEEFNADRVWVTQFHNGGNFYPTGKSMAKFLKAKLKKAINNICFIFYLVIILY